MFAHTRPGQNAAMYSVRCLLYIGLRAERAAMSWAEGGGIWCKRNTDRRKTGKNAAPTRAGMVNRSMPMEVMKMRPTSLTAPEATIKEQDTIGGKVVKI